MEDQARCYEAIYKAFWGKPWFKNILVENRDQRLRRSGPRIDTPWGKPAMDVIRRWYKK